jgi:hypothetical protein
MTGLARETAAGLGHNITLDQLALLAEFEDDSSAVSRLMNDFCGGRSGQHTAERIRQERTEQAEHGVDTATALEVLSGGLAGSKVLDAKRDNMLSRSFNPGFRIELHHKDLGIVTAAAREAGVVIPVGGLVAQLMASAKAIGDGSLDHSGLLRGVERLSGRKPATIVTPASE